MDQSDFNTALRGALGETSSISSITKAVTESIRNELEPLSNAVMSLKQEIREEFRKELVGVKYSIAALQADIQRKDDAIQRLELRIGALEEDNFALMRSSDELEQYSRRNSLRLSGVQERDGEDAAEVMLQILNSELKLEPPLSGSDIDRVHRVGPKSRKDRPILIKFATYHARHKAFSNRKLLKRSGWFLNEDLTKIRSQLLFNAREMKRKSPIMDCWSADGRVLIKNKRGVIVPIKDLSTLRKEAAVNSVETAPKT